MSWKHILITVVLAACSVFASAQDAPPKSAAERSQQRTERMAQELALTPDQVAKVSVINDQYAMRMDELKGQRGADRKAERQQQEKLREAYDADLQAVLTPEQFSTFQARREEAMKEQGAKPRMRLRLSGH